MQPNGANKNIVDQAIFSNEGPNLSNPADIYYNQFDNILAVPNSGNNTVEFLFYACNNSTIKENSTTKNLISFSWRLISCI